MQVEETCAFRYDLLKFDLPLFHSPFPLFCVVVHEHRYRRSSMLKTDRSSNLKKPLEMAANRSRTFIWVLYENVNKFCYCATVHIGKSFNTYSCLNTALVSASERVWGRPRPLQVTADQLTQHYWPCRMGRREIFVSLSLPKRTIWLKKKRELR